MRGPKHSCSGPLTLSHNWHDPLPHALLGGGRDALVAIAVVLFAVSRLVPVGVAQLYVQAAMALLALLPLAVQMWIRSPGR